MVRLSQSPPYNSINILFAVITCPRVQHETKTNVYFEIGSILLSSIFPSTEYKETALKETL